MTQDLKDFFVFLKKYFINKVLNFGKNFERTKDLIVAFLIIKRGKYSSSFLNISFFLIIGSALIGGPIIAENSPFVNLSNYSVSSQEGLISYNPYESSLGTVVSAKSRSQIENYQVKGGDSLEKIAKMFDISIDTIKWANDLKTDAIKPGQVLKIPPVTGVVHKVVSGDTVYSIAKKYGVDAQNIVNYIWNDFADQETFALTVGQIIFVPGGVIKPTPAPASSRFIASIQAGVRGSSNFIWPTSGAITQYYIWYHQALDIANPSSPPILAADSGTVVYAGCVGWGYGCHVIINHNNGYQTLYAHLSRYDVDAGDFVSQGQQIGIMGSTGRSTGTHLHFEIRNGGQLINPLNFLK
ncbi:MAG: M23 family metallopeptidase [Patescibacteria group bacterium]|nr:M23 family metallopeptidase [Patescibacteria group bacterium]